MLFKLFNVFAILTVVLFSVEGYAQEEMDPANHEVFEQANEDGSVSFKPVDRSLDANSAAKYGVLGNVGRPVTGGSSVPHSQFQWDDGDINDLTANGRERNELLGCSTMDYHASLVTSLNNSEDQIEEYVNSPMGTYMLTTLLNSPAIAATFNSVEAFGAKRVQLMQDRCQAMQSDATVSAEGMMRWQALQACVARNVAGNLDDTVADLSGSARNTGEAVAVAMAYRACLYGSQGQQDGFASDPITAFGDDIPGTVMASLEGALQRDVLSFDETDADSNPSLWTGTLFHALRNTAFCEMHGGGGMSASPEVDSVDENKCSFLAMVPNVRWCVGSEMMDRSCLDDSKVRLSRATFTPQQVFDLVFSFSELEIGYRDQYARSLMKRVGHSTAYKIAEKGETLYNPMVNRTPGDAAVANRMDEIRLFSGCITMGESGALPGAEDFNQYIDRAIAMTDSLSEDTVVSLVPEMTLGDVRDALWDPAGGDDGGAGELRPPSTFAAVDLLEVGDIESQRSAVTGDGAGEPMYGIDTFAQNVADATRCVMKHHTRLTLMDHLKLVELPDEERIGALMAIRMNIAQTTTEMLYAFLKEKLMFAQMDMQNAGSVASRRATPPHVLASLETLVKIIEGQVEHMRSLRANQFAMSGLLSNIRQARTPSYCPPGRAGAC